MQIRKKRQGRPYKNHPKIDQGTHELQHKKAMLLSGGNPQNPATAESLLGILYGHHLISQPLYEAGCFFGELGYRFEPCLGHKFRQNASILTHQKIDKVGSAPFYLSDTQDEKRTQSWNNALTALKQAGPEPYQVVLHVVFYDQDLYSLPMSPFVRKSIPALRKGLRCLETYFKEGLRVGRGTPHGKGNPGRSTTFQPPLREPPPSYLA